MLRGFEKVHCERCWETYYPGEMREIRFNNKTRYICPNCNWSLGFWWDNRMKYDADKGQENLIKGQ